MYSTLIKPHNEYPQLDTHPDRGSIKYIFQTVQYIYICKEINEI